MSDTPDKPVLTPVISLEHRREKKVSRTRLSSAGEQQIQLQKLADNVILLNEQIQHIERMLRKLIRHVTRRQ